MFQAPECFNGLSFTFCSWLDGFYSSYSADIWALGVCLLELTTGKAPVPCSNLFELTTNLRNYDSSPSLTGLSPELKDLLSHMLNKDISERLNLEAICVMISTFGDA